MFRKFSVLICSLIMVAGAPANAAEPVDLELVLAVDCSYSVDQNEFRLQMEGLAAAFSSRQVADAILGGPLQAIAVTVVQWSKSDIQVQAMDWARLDSDLSILLFAERLRGLPRLSSAGGTSISGAIAFSHLLIENNGFEGHRRIIDISSDGRNNSGRNLAAARLYTLGHGVTINGLSILNEIPTLHHYFERYVIGGPAAFVEIANSYVDYPRAILRKLLREIRPLPVSDAPLSAPMIRQASFR